MWKYYASNVGYKEEALSTFAGRAIAIDAFGIMYETRSTAKSRYLRTFNPFADKVDDTAIDIIWTKIFIDLIIDYMVAGVTPIMVFDGIANDILKTKTLQQRTAYNESYINKFDALRQSYNGVKPSAIPGKAIEDANSILSKLNLMPPSSIVLIKILCKDLGIPYVFSKEEGERTCSLMNRQKVCDAVISSDSDCPCCGAETVLKEKCIVKIGNSNEKGFKVARSSELLAAMNIDFNTFQDLCIMAGTDFNDNVKGISWVKSYNLLKKHGNIKAVSRVLDLTIINHAEVKKRFAIIPWIDTVEEYSLSFTEVDDSVFARHGLEHIADKFNRVRIACTKRRIVQQDEPSQSEDSESTC